MDRIEQRSSFNSTPAIPRSHSRELQHSATPLPHTNVLDHRVLRGPELTQHPVHPRAEAQLPLTAPHQATDTDLNRQDVIIPYLAVMRWIPSVTESVNNIKSCKVREHQSKSQADTTLWRLLMFSPQMRWPNEGYHGSNGRKWITYDDLSFPQWISGQLANIYNIQDPILAKQALLEVIMSTRDAASLPWPAVRNACAVSMHGVEEGSLDWSQTTQ